jgi:hypothetical protein
MAHGVRVISLSSPYTSNLLILPGLPGQLNYFNNLYPDSYPDTTRTESSLPGQIAVKHTNKPHKSPLKA